MARRVIETPIPDDQARRLILHNNGTQQTKVRWDPDNVAFSDFGSNDTPVGQYDAEQGGWPLVTESGGALAVTRGLAEAGPWFTPTRMWLNQRVSLSRITATFPTLTTPNHFSIQGRYLMDLDAFSQQYLSVWTGGSRGLYLDGSGILRLWDGSATRSSASSVYALIGISDGDWFDWDVQANNTTLTIRVRPAGDGAWTTSYSGAVNAMTPGGSLVYFGSSSTGSGLRAQAQFLKLYDGSPTDDEIGHLRPSMFPAGNRANGATAVDAHGRTWTITRPAWSTSTDIGRRLPSRSTAYVALPGVVGESTSTPDSAANSITGDFDLRVATWWKGNPAAAQYLMAKAFSHGSQMSYHIGLTSGGLFFCRWSSTGTSWVGGAYYSSVAVGTVVSVGDAVALKATVDVDNGASGSDLKFWYSTDDGDSWTQLGSTRVLTGHLSVFDGTADLHIGGMSNGLAEMYDGDIKWAEVRSGIDGPIVSRFNAADADPDSSTWVDPVTGQTNTINRSSSVQYHAEVMPANTEAWQSDGVNDYLTVIGDDSAADFDATTGVAWVVDTRIHSGIAAFSALMDMRNLTTGDGLTVGASATPDRIEMRIDDGTSINWIGDSATYTYSQRNLFVRTAKTGDSEAYNNGSSVETIATAFSDVAASYPLNIGRRGSGAAYAPATFFGFAIIKRRISDTDAAQIASEGLTA